jgi:hypothetical protein
VSEIAFPLFIETISQTLVDRGGSAFTLPDAKLGDTWICSLGFLEEGADNEPLEKEINVVGLRAAIGPALAPPTSGKFKLNVQGTDTDAIDFDTTAEDFLAALGVGVGVSCTKPADCCWIVRLTDDAEEAAVLEPSDDSVDGYNTLSPQSFVRVRAYQENTVWYHEIRLIQAPYAFCDTSTDELPPEPTVASVLAGAAETDSVAARNAIQKIHLPGSYKGTFYITLNTGGVAYRSAVLGGEGLTVDALFDALNGMFEGGGDPRFSVTNPEKEYAYVEFTGELAGAPQEDLVLHFVHTPPAAQNFRLPLDRATAHAALRVDTTLTTVFEIEVRYIGLDESIDDEGVEVQKLTVQVPVKLIREVIYDELATVPAINWLARMGRKSYVPFSPDAVITGSQKARFTIPAAEDIGAATFVIAHGMATDDIDSILVRENKANGRVLGIGEYTALIVDENQISITLAVAPTEANAIAVIFSTINNVATYADHQHRIAQIIGDTEGAQTLRQELDALAARCAALEALVAITGGLSRTEALEADLSLDLPERKELYPGYKTLPDLKGKLSARLLLPAIHDDAAVALAELPLPAIGDAPYTVLYNDATPFKLRGLTVDVGDFFGSDGRVFYKLTRNATSTSYFSTEFERELWRLTINDQMLRAGMAFRVDCFLRLRTFVATTEMQCMLVIEIGTAPSQATPATTATNLQGVTWNATPLLSQRIVFGDVLQPHDYGASVTVNDAGVVAARRFLYGGSAAGGVSPTTANFIIRARLRDFDTENAGQEKAKGLIYYESSGKAGIQ